MASVEQIKAKRAGVGLRALDRERACPGFTLFAPQSGGGKVCLIDLDGGVVHTWQMPYAPGNSGYLTERGTLFYNGKVIENSTRFISRQPWKGGAALEVDWSGRANGNLLLFDNGPHRLDHSMPFSRIIEIELATKKIVWKYQERRECEFFSPRISNAQRLPNGNTLICEGDFGRLFEMTGDGELVWEFVNPYFGEGPTGQNNRVFRAYRYSKEEIARAKATGGG